MVEFEGIRIVDIDAERVQPSNRAPGLRHIYLKLSHTPPTEWVRIFKDERSYPRHSMWRHAWIEGAYIVIDCVPEEIENYHLRDLRQDVATANTKYATYLQRVHHPRGAGG